MDRAPENVDNSQKKKKPEIINEIELNELVKNWS